MIMKLLFFSRLRSRSAPVKAPPMKLEQGMTELKCDCLLSVLPFVTHSRPPLFAPLRSITWLELWIKAGVQGTWLDLHSLCVAPVYESSRLPSQSRLPTAPSIVLCMMLLAFCSFSSDDVVLCICVNSCSS